MVQYNTNKFKSTFIGKKNLDYYFSNNFTFCILSRHSQWPDRQGSPIWKVFFLKTNQMINTCLSITCIWHHHSLCPRNYYPFKCRWVGSQICDCLVTWFCYQLIAKPGNKTAAPLWPDPDTLHTWSSHCIRMSWLLTGHQQSQFRLHNETWLCQQKFLWLLKNF